MRLLFLAILFGLLFALGACLSSEVNLPAPSDGAAPAVDAGTEGG